MQIESTSHGLVVNNTITFNSTGGTLPAGLDSGITYYVVGPVAANTFYVSIIEGGDKYVYTGLKLHFDGGTETFSWQFANALLNRIGYDDILDDLDDTLGDIENKRRVIIEINYE